MPEINIKTTVNDSQLKKGFAESAGNIRSWGKEAAAIFQAVSTPLEKLELEMAKIQRLCFLKKNYVKQESSHFA